MGTRDVLSRWPLDISPNHRLDPDRYFAGVQHLHVNLNAEKFTVTDLLYVLGEYPIND